MPTEKPSRAPKVSVQWVPRLLTDLRAVYEDFGEDTGDAVREALITAMESLKRYEWDESLIQRYGIVGDTFTFDFCRDYKFTFKVLTDRDENKQSIAEHYYLKRLLRKQ
jgi:hypothetical protein